MRGKLEPGVPDRAADAIAALADRGVGEADHREGREPERHVNLDVHGTRVHAAQGGGPEAGEHASRGAKTAAGKPRP
jgi:hypothetical protein